MKLKFYLQVVKAFFIAFFVAVLLFLFDDPEEAEE